MTIRKEWIAKMELYEKLKLKKVAVRIPSSCQNTSLNCACVYLWLRVGVAHPQCQRGTAVWVLMGPARPQTSQVLRAEQYQQPEQTTHPGTPPSLQPSLLQPAPPSQSAQRRNQHITHTTEDLSKLNIRMLNNIKPSNVKSILKH